MGNYECWSYPRAIRGELSKQLSRDFPAVPVNHGRLILRPIDPIGQQICLEPSFVTDATREIFVKMLDTLTRIRDLPNRERQRDMAGCAEVLAFGLVSRAR